MLKMLEALLLKQVPLSIPDIDSDFNCPYCDYRHSVDELIRFMHVVNKSTIFQCINKQCKQRFLLELEVCYKAKVFKMEEDK